MGHVQARLLIILLTRTKSECDCSFSCNGLIHISFFYTITKKKGICKEQLRKQSNFNMWI